LIEATMMQHNTRNSDLIGETIDAAERGAAPATLHRLNLALIEERLSHLEGEPRERALRTIQRLRVLALALL
jgi:hypothetical protein